MVKIFRTRKPKQSADKAVKPKKQRAFFKFLSRIGGYFKGAWQELRQVRWPDRKATCSMTAAVILFSAFFVVLIILLDDAFKGLFTLIIK